MLKRLIFGIAILYFNTAPAEVKLLTKANDQRVAVLYFVDTYFMCRHCNQLPYASQGESYLDRMSRKADKISQKPDTDDYIDEGDLMKPKHMHWQTFYRLKMAEIAAEEQMNNAFLAKYGMYM